MKYPRKTAKEAADKLFLKLFRCNCEVLNIMSALNSFKMVPGVFHFISIELLNNSFPFVESVD